MSTPLPAKECTACHETKPLTDFYKLTRAPDGHTWTCKVCAKSAVRSAYQHGYGKARVRALGRLAKAHPAEFDRLLKEELGRVGVEPANDTETGDGQTL